MLRASALFERLWRLVAGALVAALAYRALTLPDPEYDSWAYHLPFAARLWGIVPKTSVELDDHIEELLRSYPVLAEWLQGLLWSIAGRVEAANLLGLASVVLLVALLAKRFAVPWPLGLTALLAIPVVQVHATSAYIDLPGSVAASAAVLLGFRVWTRPDDSRRSDFVLGAFSAAFAACTKYTMLPVALAAFVAIALAYARFDRKSLASRGELLRRAAEIACAFALLSAFYVRNVFVHGSPLHPLQVELGPITVSRGWLSVAFEGPSTLSETAPPLRWLSSVVGVGELDAARGYWNADAASPPGSHSFRMGGFLGPWAIVNLVLAIGLGLRRRTAGGRGALVTLGALSVLVAFLPNAHQLRYIAYWMIVLVGVNLALLADGRNVPRRWLKVYAAGAIGALMTVVLLTRGRYFVPTPEYGQWPTFVAWATRPYVLARLHQGGRYCLVGSTKNVLVYAAELRRVGAYSIKSSADPALCSDREIIEVW